MHFLPSSDALAQQKKELREFYRRERRARYNVETWRHILRAPEISKAQHVASYVSYEYEPITADLNQLLLQDGKQVYLPRMQENKDLEWIAWDGAPLPTNKKGKILEPEGVAIPPEIAAHIGVVIVPALHVDREGNRLGQGGGSYDRALSKLNAWKIALVHYGELTSEPVPRQAHDMKVDAAATPDLLVRFRS